MSILDQARAKVAESLKARADDPPVEEKEKVPKCHPEKGQISASVWAYCREGHSPGLGVKTRLVGASDKELGEAFPNIKFTTLRWNRWGLLNEGFLEKAEMKRDGEVYIVTDKYNPCTCGKDSDYRGLHDLPCPMVPTPVPEDEITRPFVEMAEKAHEIWVAQGNPLLSDYEISDLEDALEIFFDSIGKSTIDVDMIPEPKKKTRGKMGLAKVIRADDMWYYLDFDGVRTGGWVDQKNARREFAKYKRTLQESK